LFLFEDPSCDWLTGGPLVFPNKVSTRYRFGQVRARLLLN
jgi:hypothetical protein